MCEPQLKHAFAKWWSPKDGARVKDLVLTKPSLMWNMISHYGYDLAGSFLELATECYLQYLAEDKDPIYVKKNKATGGTETTQGVQDDIHAYIKKSGPHYALPALKIE